jgi:DNA-binding beta-propeller fold protein YncE
MKRTHGSTGVAMTPKSSAREMLLLSAAVLLGASVASAEIAISANDAKPKLTDGVVSVDANRGPDNVVILDMKGPMPKVIGKVDNVPTSVVGPPTSVAITPDESLALVSASTKIDPSDSTKFASDNTLTVIDLTAKPPAVIATLEAGQGASGISINRQGTLALVANRNDGTVSIFTISGKTVTPAGKVDTGNPKSGPNHAAISPDGKFALLTRFGDHMTTVLSIDGSKVEMTKRNIFAGLVPDAIEITSDGAWAVMANIGMGQGDADTISLIDLKLNPPRVVDTATTGQSPEHLSISRDGKWIAVSVQNGSNRSAASGFSNPLGLVQIFTIKNRKLVKVTEVAQGGWPQGVVFSNDGKTVLAGNMVQHSVWVYSFDGKTLKKKGEIPMVGGSAGLRIAGGN